MTTIKSSPVSLENNESNSKKLVNNDDFLLASQGLIIELCVVILAHAFVYSLCLFPSFFLLIWSWLLIAPMHLSLYWISVHVLVTHPNKPSDNTANVDAGGVQELPRVGGLYAAAENQLLTGHQQGARPGGRASTPLLPQAGLHLWQQERWWVIRL